MKRKSNWKSTFQMSNQGIFREREVSWNKGKYFIYNTNEREKILESFLSDTLKYGCQMRNLTHLFPMHPFCTPWKYQNFRFSDVLREQRKGALETNGLTRIQKLIKSETATFVHWNFWYFTIAILILSN